MDVTGPQDVPYCKVTLNSQYLKIGLTDSIQILHVVVAGFQSVPYFNHNQMEEFFLHFSHTLPCNLEMASLSRLFHVPKIKAFKLMFYGAHKDPIRLTFYDLLFLKHSEIADL